MFCQTCHRGSFQDRKKGRSLAAGEKLQGRRLAVEDSTTEGQLEKKAMPRGHKLPESHLAAEKKIRNENQWKDKSSLLRTSPEGITMKGKSTSLGTSLEGIRMKGKGMSSSLGTSLEVEELEGINIMENFSLERVNIEAAGKNNIYKKYLSFTMQNIFIGRIIFELLTSVE
jgi:hypothetical protein